MLLFRLLSTLLLLDTALLRNGIWTILNDPGSPQLLGREKRKFFVFFLQRGGEVKKMERK